MRRAALPSSGLYPLAVLSPDGPRVRRRGGAARVRASPRSTSPRWSSATAELPHRAATRSFAEGVAWLAQIGLFVMLGLLLSPEPDHAGASSGSPCVAGLVLTVRGPAGLGAGQLGRAADAAGASWRSCRGPGCAARCRSCWRRSRWPRGSTDAERALRHRLRDGRDLHAAHRPDPAAGRQAGCGSTRRSEPRDLDVEAAPLERIAADLLQVTISPVSRLHGVEVGELRLPAGVVGRRMVVRDGQTLVPERRTVLRRGDDLLVVTPRRLREATEQRLRDGLASAAGWRSGCDEPLSVRQAGAGQSSAATQICGRLGDLDRAACLDAASRTRRRPPRRRPGPSVVAADDLAPSARAG